ncbi:MAG: flagellar biosynthetic protein FliQ [Calditrichia bacterium]
MTSDYVLYITREMLMTGIYILLPILGVTLVVGVLIAIMQSVTQINEMTLTFVPKVGVVGLLIFLLLPWFLELLRAFMLEIFQQIILIAQ